MTMSNSIRVSRWYVKKAARRAVVLGHWASELIPELLDAPVQPKLRVLTYHRFGHAVRDPFCVAPDDFESQMRWLADERLAVSLADVEAFLAGRKDLPARAVLVTVDDGFESVLTEMLPILRAHAIPAVAYVSPGLVGDEHAAPPTDGAQRYLGWRQLETLLDGGMTIGSHGFSHRSLGRIELSEARDEIFRSRETLQSRLGCAITSLAYPYGTLADFSADTARLIHEAGYTTAFTSQHGSIARGADAWSLPRIKIEGGEGLGMFRHICRGGMDAWRLVDRALWRLQRP